MKIEIPVGWFVKIIYRRIKKWWEEKQKKY